MHQPQDDRCALILAGGNSIRLVRTSRKLGGTNGHGRYCEVYESGTLLEKTLQRVLCVVPSEQTYALVSGKCESFLGKRDEAARLIVQPENRGTAAALLYSVLSIHRRNPKANIAIFRADPTLSDSRLADPCFRSEIAVMMRVRSAFRIVERKPELIVLLGIVPDYPAMGHGWIEPGEAMADVRETAAFRIQQFWENPSLDRAAMDRAAGLMARGCLWNSHVVIGSAEALLLLMRDGAPSLYNAFAPARPMLGTVKEKLAVERVYTELQKMDFYSEVLPSAPQLLAVLPVGECTSHAHSESLITAELQQTELQQTELQQTGGAGG